MYLGEMAQYRVTIPISGACLKVYEMNPRIVAASGPCVLDVAAEDVVVLPHGVDA